MGVWNKAVGGAGGCGGGELGSGGRAEPDWTPQQRPRPQEATSPSLVVRNQRDLKDT